MIIKLRNYEYDLLIDSNFQSEEAKLLIRNARKKENICYLDVDSEIVNEIRENLIAQFQFEGIGQGEEPTKEGIIIEDLIDKFFTG